jgi:hypothetical protein
MRLSKVPSDFHAFAILAARIVFLIFIEDWRDLKNYGIQAGWSKCPRDRRFKVGQHPYLASF